MKLLIESATIRGEQNNLQKSVTWVAYAVLRRRHRRRRLLGVAVASSRTRSGEVELDQALFASLGLSASPLLVTSKQGRRDGFKVLNLRVG